MLSRSARYDGAESMRPVDSVVELNITFQLMRVLDNIHLVICHLPTKNSGFRGGKFVHCTSMSNRAKFTTMVSTRT